MEKWIMEIMNHPVLCLVMPKWLGKEDYDRVLRAAKTYPNCSKEDTVFLLDVLKISLEKIEEKSRSA